MPHYVVLKSVGPHEPGEIVEITEDHANAGVDVQRLLDLEAIREASDEEVKGGSPRLLNNARPDRTVRMVVPVAPNNEVRRGREKAK